MLQANCPERWGNKYCK